MHYPQITGTQKNFVFDWIVEKNRKCLHDGRHTHTHKQTNCKHSRDQHDTFVYTAD